MVKIMLIDSSMFNSEAASTNNDRYIDEGRYTLRIVDEKECRNGSLCVVMEVESDKERGFRFCDFFDLSDDRGRGRFWALVSNTAKKTVSDSSELVGELIEADLVVNTYAGRDGVTHTKNRVKRYAPVSLMNKPATAKIAARMEAEGFKDIPF